MEEKIIQIIAAPNNIIALYPFVHDDGEADFNPQGIVCLALTDQGDVKLMDVDRSGKVSIIKNHDRIAWRR